MYYCNTSLGRHIFYVNNFFDVSYDIINYRGIDIGKHVKFEHSNRHKTCV